MNQLRNYAPPNNALISKAAISVQTQRDIRTFLVFSWLPLQKNQTVVSFLLP